MTERFKAIGCDVWQGNKVWCVAGSKHSADVIAEALNMLHEENINIKQTIKDMMENERTHIGYNVLKQLMEAIN